MGKGWCGIHQWIESEPTSIFCMIPTFGHDKPWSLWTSHTYTFIFLYEYSFKMEPPNLLAICVSSFEKYLFRPFVHFSLVCIFFLFLFFHFNFVNFLYILDINHLSDVRCGNIFSHFISWHCILLTSSFLWRSYLVWCNATCLFGGLLPVFLVSWPKISSRTMSRRISPVIYYNSFIASVFFFKSLVSFELILYMVWDKGTLLFFCLRISSFTNNIYWKDYLSPLCVTDMLVKDLVAMNICIYFLALYSIPLA